MSVQELTKKRTIIKTKVTTFQTFLKKLDIDTSNAQELPLRLERAEKLLSEYDEVQSHIEELTDVDTEERTKFEDTFYATILLGRNTATRLSPSTSKELTAPAAIDITTHINSLLKLPDLKLPTFNGEYDQWITFRDTFEAIIDSNTSLSKIQKFYYLQSAVKVHHHIQAVFELPVLTKESCINMRKLIDDIQQHTVALEKLEQSVQSWDTLLIHLLTPKLDVKTKREWEFKREFSELPSMKEFIDFLNKRCSILETLLSNQLKDTSSANTKSQKKSVSLTAQSSVEKQCPLCKNSHWLYACPSFRKLSSNERLREAKRLKVCLNCLRSHPERECTFGSCQRCKRRHNTMLHLDNDNSQIKSIDNEQREVPNKKTEDDSVVRTSTTATTSHCTNKGVVHSLLSTAIVLVRDHNGYYQECRALLDSASQSHFMTEELCLQRLQLNTFKTNHLINGIGQTSVFVNDRATTVMKSKYNEYNTELSCFVVDSITGTLPPDKFDVCQFTIPKNILLADPKYNIPAKIDLLIGVTLFYNLLQERRISLDNNQPVLQETKLGWIIGGAFVPCRSSSQFTKSKPYTKEEQLCEDNFVSTHQRDENGRFIVQLPLKSPISSLGKSQEIAERRLRSVERKLHKDVKLKEAYISFMQEYERLDHMSEIREAEDKAEHANYLPHHAVVKSTSSTTKVRVVFDASCKTTSVQTFRLNTVTYGLASAPFLAIRCLHQLALECQTNLPKTSETIKRDFYVDNLITGGNDLSQLKILKEDITNVLRSGCFELYKWNSNEKSILAAEEEEATDSVNFDKEVNTLGLIWNTNSDIFQYRINARTQPSKLTKRVILSIVSQIFDSLGLIGPITIQSKLLLQDLWRLKIDWDDPVLIELHSKWSYFQDQIRYIPEILTPRHAFSKEYNTMEVHGFCNASEIAYGCCIYIKTINSSGEATVNLLCAKSKVAPLKNVSLPRLELCAALLLAKLYRQVMQALTITPDSTYLWSDSTITLAWIKGEPSRWVQFVANRVTEIQQLTVQGRWNYVNSKENSVDIISRGMNPTQLKASHLWWNGPDWLKTTDWPLPKETTNISEDLLEERKSTKIFHSQVNDSDELFLRFSSLTKLKRVIGYCLRFKQNVLQPDLRTVGPLAVAELKNAMTVLVSLAQHRDFINDIRSLKSCGQISKTSKLRSLVPFLDGHNVMRVGGRLSNAPIPYAQKYPIILPSKHPLTRLIIVHEHYKHLHAGPQALLAAIRVHFWPLHARCTVKDVLRKYIVSFRAKPPMLQQRMGDLPATRIMTSRPFLNTGIDYGGPFTIKISRNKTDKAHICIFVCFTTRAVHLELVVDLSTLAFIRTLQRFIARRGKCANLYSDNAKNFVGANNELREVGEVLRNPEHHAKISDFLVENSINWNLIPPHSPHMGGLWKAAIKSAKTHLRKIIRTTPLSNEELYTLLVRIEACLNSRPLCPLTDDGIDLAALTPAHFLIGVPLTSFPEVDVSNEPVNRLTRHQLTHNLYCSSSISISSSIICR
ncbi:uncharacterized protein [Mycetomoellerius zeteki]|uniref:uncharacterized protein n=1 Tax=Mycetomoellerius zeteki TaxID=64791 RepID=UPI00084E505A|nr:PREDICTED: uncharacterized protein LOC108726840 [Trachymyrmex zeteki]